MKVLIVLAAVVAAACAAHISDAEVKSQFEAFKLKHGKTYASEAEELFRSKIFKDNLIRVNEHNARFDRKEVTFTVGINKFSDMHLHEIVEARNGLKPDLKTPSQKVHKAPLAWPWSKKVDWRKKGVVTPVKDQGTCGSCWTFSATGALEGQLAIKHKKLVSLSEQNLVDCTNNDQYEMNGCEGGLMDSAFQYIADNDGIDSEESYPYLGVDSICAYNVSNKAGVDSGFVDVGKTEKDLQHAVQTVGPVSIAIDASLWSFNHYSGGVYYDEQCGNTRYDLDHGVLAVGFGSNSGWGSDDYWIVKNSWGAEWGENGYIRMARNKKNACGVATMASYPTL
ncbi:hypothetical protein ONE63_011012 [Megalurothrips usitatus]|uniref:Cathepsin L n=1 Tax=Megalurothrips usitatus TaxID=439358 RepID=A0AAV7XFR6_9NEOP|nr:hypothetical protein ONE63_011011 [Megalurothrips usitatus]KAJ1524520.1 hypothetical protein ONE63_011012 [Megalurothrips usitatus]